MLGNKYLFSSLVFGRFNIDRIFRQCIRNLSFDTALCQKLKLKEGNEKLTNVCQNDIESVNVNSPYNDVDRVHRVSQFESSIYSEVEEEQIEQENVNYEFNEEINIDKMISINITEEKGYTEYERLNMSYDEAKLISSYRPMTNDMIKKMTSFPILGSESAEINFKGNNKEPGVPSVSIILRQTMSADARKALDTWKTNMIDKLGQDRFNIYFQDLLKNGKLLHSCIRSTLQNEKITIAPQVELAYNSLKPVFMDLEKVKTLETYVIHPNLVYKGIVDCIAVYRGELCVIDWKKSDKDKSTLESTYDAPVQVSAYVGAVNASSLYPFTITKGLVVVAYTNGQPATVHELKDDLLQKSWKNWLARLKQFYTDVSKK
ncbi:mitochondrial genome maintenance exonuclease 1 [Nomia melanderi]|uniref:mitochondrial genome maintenance exonuclease 1 n=1 Tax=Nomia melanderi TaxID=2448451 RepID=UPI003FCD103A